MYTLAIFHPDNILLVEILTNVHIVDSVPPVEHDRRITLGGQMVQIRTESTMLEDRYSVIGALRSAGFGASVELPGIHQASLHRHSSRPV